MIFGLTGGIASGKSTVLKLLAKRGCPTLDADALAAELRAPGGLAHDAIKREFGTTDREALRALILKDPGSRAKLESILHPLIGRESMSRLRLLARQNPDRPVIYEATLLVETDRWRDFDGLIVCVCDEETRIERFCQRNAITRAEALQWIRSQTSDTERLKAATYQIATHGSLEELEARVDVLLTLLRAHR